MNYLRNDEIKAAVANNLDAQGLNEDAASVRNVKTYEGNTTTLTSDGGDWEVTPNGSYIDTVESIITPVLDALITPTPTPDEPTVEEPTTYVAQLMSDETSQPSARGPISFEVLTKYLENKMFLTSFFERDFGSPNLLGTWDTGSMPVKQIYEDMDSTVANLVKMFQNKSDFSTLFGAPTNFIEKINLANANNKITPKKSSLTADEFAKITPENLLSKIKIDGISKSDMKNLEVIDFSATSPSITFKISSYGAISDPITVSWTVDGTAPAPTPAPTPTPSPDVVLINKINTAIAEKNITPKTETITSAQFDEISADNILDKVDIKGITNKMINRHPHIFVNKENLNLKDVLLNWESIKMEEKGFTSYTDTLKHVPKNLPGLMRADKIQQKAAKVGFDFHSIEAAMEKILEELQEVKDVYKGKNRAKIVEEVGDLVFSTVNVARLLDIDPEFAVNYSIDKFIDRFQYIEENARDRKLDLVNMTLAEMDTLWNESKEQ